MYLMSGPRETVSFVSDVCPGPDVSLGKQNQLVSCGTWYYWFVLFLDFHFHNNKEQRESKQCHCL